MEIPFGPFVLRHYFGKGYSDTELAFVTNRKGGMARRETAVRIGFKSEHLTELVGRDNPNDRYHTPDGNIVFGKIVFTPGGGVHVLSAAEVYAGSLAKQALKAAASQAAQVEPVTVTVDNAEPKTAPAKGRGSRRAAVKA